MALVHSSVIVTTTAVDTRARDQLSFPFLARPQVMTMYLRFVEMGTVTMAANTRVLFVGSNAGANPWVSIETSGTFYRITHTNVGGTQVTSTLAAAPTVGQGVELRGILNSNGSVLLGQSLNGATETVTSTSGAAILATAWANAIVWFNSLTTGNVGMCAFRNVKIVAGVQTMQQMRVLAGTD